jgi:hypothetical protein
MNRLAVALAADSAVTTAQKKVYNSANKLFMLSSHEPVGIMVYNNASLMSVPWETLIKDFRANLGRTRFNKLEEYGSAFFSYLDSKMQLFDRETQKQYFLELVEGYFNKIARHIRRAVEREESAFAQTMTPEEADQRRAEIYREIISEYADSLAREPKNKSLAADVGRDLATECSREISDLTLHIFKETYPKFGHEEVTKLRQYAIDLVEREPIATPSLSGVVVAGFGVEEFFPALQAFEVGDVYGDRLKVNPRPIVQIGEDKATHIETFADSDTADAFLRGLPAEFERQILEWAYEAAEEISREAVNNAAGLSTTNRKSLDQHLVAAREKELVRFVTKIEEYKRETFIEPTEDAILNLPKDELAHVAAALVNINLLKKRMSMALETVGGPIDVAVISKGDGFIWIDRKHYFTASKNPQFLCNHYGSGEVEPEEENTK